MSSSKAELDAISSDYNSYIVSKSFGAKYGDPSFAMEAPLIAKNNVETALRLMHQLGTSRSKKLGPLAPKFYVTSEDWVAKCSAGVPDLIPTELVGGSRCGFKLQPGVTCTQQFYDQEEQFQRAVHSTSITATEATLPSLFWFRGSLQALLRSESGHQADIYTECTIGGSASETVYYIQKWCTDNGKDEAQVAYYLREILQCLIYTDTFPQYTKAVDRSIKKERSNREQDPVAVLACLIATGNRLIRGEGLLARRASDAEWWAYPDNDWSVEEKKTAEDAYIRMRAPTDPESLAAAEVAWEINLGPRTAQVYEMWAGGGAPHVALYTATPPIWDPIAARFLPHNANIDPELANTVDGYIDFYNEEAPDKFQGFQIIPEHIKSTDMSAPMNKEFLRERIAADLRFLKSLVNQVCETTWETMEVAHLIQCTKSVDASDGTDPRLEPSTSIGELKSLSCLTKKGAKTGIPSENFANAVAIASDGLTMSVASHSGAKDG